MKAARRIVQLSLGVFVFWLVLAMPPSFSDLAWGLAAATLSGVSAGTLLWREKEPGIGARAMLGLALHVVVLIRSIVPAALQVARVVLDPALPIHPKIIRHRSELQGRLQRVTLANTITLTPGTHCVDLDGDEVTIHCLDPSFAVTLIDGDIERRISRSLGTAPLDD